MAENKKKKVYVAMSGGVDSSVAALLLKQQGFEVTGIYMRNWHADIHDGFIGDCPWKEDMEDVKKVCNILGIPFKLWDFSKEYYQDVVEYFFREYAAGRTPNPDVMCNKYIKFGKFLEKALTEGANYVATGHYARLWRKIPNDKFQITNKPKILISNSDENYQLPVASFQLLSGIDTNKDQSYFLWTLKQNQLQHILFPIGEFYKSEIRKIAEQNILPTYDKPDSQGICFIGEIDVNKFLKTRLPEKVGDIITVEGKKVGKHRGAYYYTEGQRRGLNASSTFPYYVVKKDVNKNIVTVAEGPWHESLFSSKLTAANASWISEAQIIFPLDCEARIRYRQPLFKCKVNMIGEELLVEFLDPQRAVAKGQSIVFYNREEILGGATIT